MALLMPKPFHLPISSSSLRVILNLGLKYNSGSLYAPFTQVSAVAIKQNPFKGPLPLLPAIDELSFSDVAAIASSESSTLYFLILVLTSWLGRWPGAFVTGPTTPAPAPRASSTPFIQFGGNFRSEFAAAII